MREAGAAVVAFDIDCAEPDRTSPQLLLPLLARNGVRHEEAERLEHAVSAAFEKKLVAKLGDKDRCPHGNGLALRSPSERRKQGLILLSEAEAGAKYKVFSVYERDRKLLEFFEAEGIRPGTRITVKSRNYDGTVSLSANEKTSRLGGPAADKIWVARI